MSHSDSASAAEPGPPSPYLLGPYAPVDAESDLADLPVTGALPRDLDGVYVRNGPNPRYRPRGRYHWFDGDGMLHAVRFRGGKASYRSRFVATHHLAREAAEDRALWTGLLHPITDNPPDAPYKDTANTDVLCFGGELLATWYICGLPYRVDPVTLDTRGAHAFGQDRPRRISAHGKVDPRTGELLYFSYDSRPRLDLGVVAPDGQLTHRLEIPLPGPRLPHDMAITDNHAILMDLPVYFTERAIAQKRWRATFHRDVPARFAVVERPRAQPSAGAGAGPRPGGAIRWFEAEPCYIYHTVNAWEEGDEVVLVACRCDDPMPEPDYERDGAWAHVMANLRLRARLHEWRFDLTTGATRERTLDDRNSEFPCINQGRLGRPGRYSYHATLADARTLLFDGLVKYDLTTGASERYPFGPGRHGSEAAFAPRSGQPGTDPATAEDDGYLVTLVAEPAADRTEVLVLDAADIAAGPIARATIPRRIPLGFHATWVPGTALPCDRG